MKISTLEKSKKILLLIFVFLSLILIQEAFLNFFFPAWFVYLSITFILFLYFKEEYKMMVLVIAGLVLDLFSFYPFGVFTFCILLSFLMVDIVGGFFQEGNIITNSFLLGLFLAVFYFSFPFFNLSLNWLYGVF